MAHKYEGGCAHHKTYSDKDPIDNHTCHCSVCKRVTGQPTTHVVFFNHGDMKVEGADKLKRIPFNDQNPNGPLELCLCEVEGCGTPIMLDDKMKRIRVAVPNLMGFDPASLPATYHAFYDPASGVEKPNDGRPVHEGLRPDFVWPEPAKADAAHKFEGGCAHHSAYSDKDPIDSHTCHCSVCKRVTGQPTTHVVFFNHGDYKVEGAGSLKRMPFNDQNPNGPLELCVCETCGTPIMLDDKVKRIRVTVPNLMGFDPASMPATYHAFYDPATGVPKPDDGRPVYEGLRPDFVWPAGAAAAAAPAQASGGGFFGWLKKLFG